LFYLFYQHLENGYSYASNHSRKSSSLTIFVEWNHTPTTTEVPKGYFAIYLGEKQEKKRYVIPVSLLCQPSFQDVLRQAEEEFGYDHLMDGFTITCSEEMFVDLACRLGVFDLACHINTQSR
ncbi:Auxin responsive SAUR protein, partial [Cynara cardunculus var. scolymus]